MALYQDILIEHYRHSRYRGTLAHADFSSEEHNPSCGDSVSFTGIIRDGKITQLMFDGKGCVISQAAASLLIEQVCNKTIADVMQLDAAYMKQLVGIPLGPTRLRCALLPLEALQQGLASWQKKHEGASC